MKKKVIIIPDSFKGSLTSEEAAKIIKKSAEKAGFEAIAFPVADGGEGSVDCILSVKGGTRFFKTVTGPDGNDTEAMYGITSDNIAVIEIAESSGITKQTELHPMTAGTFGFGSLISDALDKGARVFYLCLGGSASTDCGTGMAAALGARFFNEKNESFIPCGDTLSDIAHVDISGLDKRISESSFCVMTDVTNPLYGPEGAAVVFAPQKGADPEQVKKLDMGLKNAAERIAEATGIDEKKVCGAGAAGGTGYGCAAFLNAKTVSGIDMMLDLCGFDKMVKDADLIVTGEGRVDNQSLMGKVLSGILARSEGKPVTVFCGINELGEDTAERAGIEVVQTGDGRSTAESMKNAAVYLKEAADRYFRKFTQRTNILKVLLLFVVLCVFPCASACIFIDEEIIEEIPDPSEDPAPTEPAGSVVTPFPTATAGLTATPETTVAPETAVIPEPTATSEPETTPEPTVTPQPTAVPGLLLINEVLPTNNKYNKHNGAYHDMVELYNASDETILLSDFCLSDSKKHLTDYPLPDIGLAPGGYAVVYCTGEYDAKDDSDLGFKLSYFGEKLYLSDKAGNIKDEFKYPELPQNVSAGREGEEIRFYVNPSMGKPNQAGLTGIAETPLVNVAPGFYENGIEVSFVSAGEIRYTLDGSKPDKDSRVWDGKPIKISSNTAIRAYAFKEGALDSFDVTYSYFINAPEYELDVVRVSLKGSDFDTLNENYDKDLKYAANISLFSGGELKFSEDCSISLFGGSSKRYSKKSYKVKFSSEYGPTKLKYKVFDDLDIDEFDSLVLRSGSQDNEEALMRDEFTSGVSMSTGLIDSVLVQAYKPVDLYVNDEYWGIYYIREHVDEDMVSAHYGCDPEEVTIIKQMKDIEAGKGYRDFLDLWEYIKKNGLTSDEAYEYAGSVVDLKSVADYYIIQLWCGNLDMDNVKVAKARGKWFFILYDLDLTFCKPVEGTTERQIGTFNSSYYTLLVLR